MQNTLCKFPYKILQILQISMVDPSVILKLFEKFYEPNNDKYGTVVFDIGLSGLYVAHGTDWKWELCID